MKFIKANILTLLFCLLNQTLICNDYIVKRGDTLSIIAEKELGSKSKWQEIADLNKLKPPYIVKLNQKLKLPTPMIRDAVTQPKLIDNTEPEPEESPFHLYRYMKELLIWGVFTFFIFWGFLTCSIRVGCWFSLIETNIFYSGLLSLFISLMTVASIATIILLTYLHYQTHLPTLGFFATGLVIFIGNCIFIVLTAKKILKCYWRSLVTLLFMTTTFGQATTLVALWLLALSLPKLLSTEVIQNIWQQIPF